MTRHEYVLWDGCRTVVQIQAWVYATRRLYDIRTLRKSSRRLPPSQKLPSSSPSPLSSYPPLSSTVWFFSLSSFLFPSSGAVHISLLHNCIFLFCTIATTISSQIVCQSASNVLQLLNPALFSSLSPSVIPSLEPLFHSHNHSYKLFSGITLLLLLHVLPAYMQTLHLLALIDFVYDKTIDWSLNQSGDWKWWFYHRLLETIFWLIDLVLINIFIYKSCDWRID